MPALLRALGLRPLSVPMPVEPPIELTAAPRAAPTHARAFIMAERGGLAVVLLEVPATDPLETARIARRLWSRDRAPLSLLVVATGSFRRLAFCAPDLRGGVRQLVVERLRPRRSDIETLEEMVARPGEAGIALALRYARALDRVRLGRRFFQEFRARRGLIAAAWTGLPRRAGAERDELALLLLCRLMFLYFLQRDGHLAGDRRLVPGLLARHRRAAAARREAEPTTGADTTAGFYRTVLEPLFFGALNTRPEQRDAAARRLGPLPYLNGGLFQRHPVERRFPELDLPDSACVSAIEELLEHYRFTTREAPDDGAAELGVDPEMIGRVFEELMAGQRRLATGTFYTPVRVVDALVRRALDALLGADADAIRRLRNIRVLDPACGSGAFLLGALSRITRARVALGESAEAVRRDLVGHALYGVDIQHDAALLCSLRLWLALTLANPAPPLLPPLPNLDRRIRQGDALLEPLDLASGPAAGRDPWRRAGADASMRAALAGVTSLGRRYVGSGPEERPAVLAALHDAERTLARAWLRAAERRARRRERELEATSLERDLFGERTAEARRAAAELRAGASRARAARRLRTALRRDGELPFFSFGVHFGDAAVRGFDLVLSNPPWVRAARWPAAGASLRHRYSVCAGGWALGARLAGAPAGAAAQVDLALLFLERSLGLLAPGGVLAMLLPAKFMRSLYGGGGRRLLGEQCISAIDDHALDPHAVFRADAFACAVIVQKRAEPTTATTATASRPGLDDEPPPRAGPEPLAITMSRKGRLPLRFRLQQTDLSLVPGDPAAPWLLAPPGVVAAVRTMQAAGPPLGRCWRVSRGVFTGANDVLLLRRVAPGLGDLARVEAEGALRGAHPRRYRDIVEDDALAALVRGAGIRAWRFDTTHHIVWLRDTQGRHTHAPPRLARYLERHARRLRTRRGAAARPLGTVFRVGPGTLCPKVAWHDLAANLNAVALPATIRTAARIRPLVPLNTVYFVAVPCHDDALVLAALLNSLPVRTLARTIAERAKDARFRFFAWTVAAIPLPAAALREDVRRRLLAISAAAHRDGGLEADGRRELDDLVAGCYGLDSRAMAALTAFDAWLRPCKEPEA
jgi:Eco57I restriction-modification methylase